MISQNVGNLATHRSGPPIYPITPTAHPMYGNLVLVIQSFHDEDLHILLDRMRFQGCKTDRKGSDGEFTWQN